MANDLHPAYRCAPCDRDWPNAKEYNLCPRCQRCTFATTTETWPDRKEAAAEAERYERIREFDAECDAAADANRVAWNVEMDALLERTPSIPDPEEA